MTLRNGWMVLPLILSTGCTPEFWFLLFDPSFESSTPVPSEDGPDDYDEWKGEVVEAVGSEQGIDPSDGDRMLAFRASSRYDADEDNIYVSDGRIMQAIDLPDDAPGQTFTVTARFAGATGEQLAFYEAGVDVWFFPGEPADIDPNPIMWYDALDQGTGRLSSVTTEWAEAGVTMEVPADADFVVVGLSARDVSTAEDGSVQRFFSGFFADEVTVELVP